MTEQTYIIVDVGCIECGEQTVVRGIFTDPTEASTAIVAICDELDIKDWEPRGGFLEFASLIGSLEGPQTFLRGTGYFTHGQHALELHVFPPPEPEQEENIDDTRPAVHKAWAASAS